MTITINGTTGISGVDGSAGTPSLQGQDTNTGFFYGTDILGFSTGGSERMRLDSSGNLGLGVTPSAWSSSYKSFQIGKTYLSDTSGYTFLGQNWYVNSGGTTVYTANDYATLYRQASGTHAWFTAPSGTAGNAVTFTQAMTLDASGRLGIGTTSPVATLDITSGTSRFRCGGDGSGNTIQESVNTAGNAYANLTLYSYNQIFATQGSERMRIDSSGNVGIGTSSPSAKLAVSGSSTPFWLGGTGTNTIYQTLNSSGGNYYIGVSSSTGTGLLSGASAYSICLVTESARDMIFGTNNTERMRIDSSGNLLVGTPSAVAKFHVNQTDNTGGMRVTTPSTFTATALWSVANAAASTNWYHFYGTSSGTSVANVVIQGNGNVQNANNSYGAFSDIKLKENIIDATPKLEALCKVRVVNYNFKGDYEKRKQLGVIAQELEQVFPGLVEETNDRDSEGNATDEKTKSVKYSVFVPMLIKAIQELTARVIELEKK